MASLLNIKYTKSKSVKDPMFRKGDNGIDLFIPDDFFFDNKYILKPNEFIIIDSGIAFELPENYFLISATRSSNCLRGLVSTCTVVDSMYRGNVHLQVHNISNDSIMICNGDKLVQFVLL
jgi:dUTPase